MMKPEFIWQSTNSTSEIRSDQIILSKYLNNCREIEKAIHKLKGVHAEHIKAYDAHGGKDNARRLTGYNSTEYFSNFSAGK